MRLCRVLEFQGVGACGVFEFLSFSFWGAFWVFGLGFRAFTVFVLRDSRALGVWRF